MKKYIKYLFLLMFLGSSALFASEKALLKELFSNLDPTIMGNEFQQALTNNNEEELIRITATYFRNRSPRRYFRDYQNSKYNRDIADKAVTGDITVVNFPWQFPDGKIDWFFNPTGKEVPHTNEWMWQLNRMSFWIDMSGLFEDTGDKKYSQAFNDQVYSWVISAGKCGAEWNVPNSSWRTIETGIRLMHAWPYSFEVFRTSEDFTDKNICLMLGSMYQQAVHLQKHYTKQNWLLMEMSGLYTFAALFPEFKQSASMRTFATKIFSKAITEQILPDGMHYELSPDYHSVTLGCAFKFCKIAQAENLSSDLPKELLQLLELSYESSMLMATPHLKSPRTNDCPTVSVPRIMQQALKLFPHRQDFKWFATNRKEGHPPLQNFDKFIFYAMGRICCNAFRLG